MLWRSECSCSPKRFEDVPFDLRHRRILLYEFSFGGYKQLQGSLNDHVRGVLDRNDGASSQLRHAQDSDEEPPTGRQ
jgi:hypothetical protein